MAPNISWENQDNQLGKIQITFGISVGVNNVPTMLTIQKGNVQDITYMQSMIQLCSKILPNYSLLVFDNGGNTKTNKKAICEKDPYYLTRKVEKKGSYQKAIKFFKDGPQIKFTSNDKECLCVKMSTEDAYQYIFFSKSRQHEQQVYTKNKKFQKALKTGSKFLKKS
jgi:transposase